MNDFQEIFAKNSHYFGKLVVELDKIRIIMGIDYDEYDYYWVLQDLNGKISYTSMVVPLVVLEDVTSGNDIEYLTGLFHMNDKHRDFPMFSEMLKKTRYMEFLKEKPVSTQTWVAYKNFEAREFHSEEEARNFSFLVECVEKNCEEIRFYENVLRECRSETFVKYYHDLKKFLWSWFGDRTCGIVDRRMAAALELADLIEDEKIRTIFISNYMKYESILRADKND